jgi:hypothetical protein
MNTKPHIAEIDAQIAKLQHAKTVLLGLDSTPTKGKRGRPKGSDNKKATAPNKRRKMSAEGRARIAAAQKKRWAAAKKAAAK